jgi:predicted alpha/beta-fold hydrolase
MIEREFTPATGLANPHLQTLWAPLLRRAPRPPRRRETLELADGDCVYLDWCEAPGNRDDAPLVILLHGLAGCSVSSYILGLQAALSEQGLESVVLNFRGSTGEPNRLARSYHSGETGDLDALVRHIQARFPGRPLAAAGFSLGGNVLLKWLGEQGDGARLVAACAVSVPLRLDLCATRMDQGFSRRYRDHLLTILKRQIDSKRERFVATGNEAERARLDALNGWRESRSFWEFDDRVVAPLHGFTGVDDYYARSSSRQFLASIRVPTLLIQAEDDPFMTPEVLPEPDELSDSVIMQVTSHGGHVGFIEGSLMQPNYWLERRIPEFLAAELLSSGIKISLEDPPA